MDIVCGKNALCEDLVKNAAALPSTFQIILHDSTIGLANLRFGVKWHKEVNEVAIPNLCEHSM